MSKGFKHKDIGDWLTKEKWIAADGHELSSGDYFPVSPSEGDIFYKSNDHKCYIYNGSEWRELSSEYVVQTNEPTNPKKGTLWFDTGNDVLKVWV